MSNASQLTYRLSGGAANTDPNASLGGARSTVAGALLDGQSVAYNTGSIGGVTLVRAGGCTETTGGADIDFTLTGTTLAFTDDGDSQGPAVDVSSDGEYILFSDNGVAHITVSVVSASLPGSNTNATLDIADIANELFDDISAADASLGDVEYRCFYVSNESGSGITMNSVAIFIGSDTVSPDTSLELGLDPAGINGTATTIVDEDTAPGGVTFSVPTSGSPLAIGTLTDGDFQAVWVRRTVSATTSPEPDDASRIATRVNI